MASKITIKRSTTAVPPAGLSFGEMAFVQGTGLTANQLYVGISGGSPVWVGAQIGTTGSWTDNAAKTSLATQYAIDQRITTQISSNNPIITADDNSNATKYLIFTSGVGSGITLGVDTSTTALSYNPSTAKLTVSGDVQLNGDLVSIKPTGDIFPSVVTNLTVGLAATGITMGATSGTFRLQNPTLVLGNTGSTITTKGGTANSISIQPYGSLLLQPNTTAAGAGGSLTSVVVTNTVDGAGQVRIAGGDLALGNKATSEFSSEPVNIVFEGATPDANKTTLTVVDPTANRTINLPNASDTLVGKATTDTFTNKTYDTGNTGNVFRIAGVTLTAVTGTGSVVLGTNPTITTSLIAGSTTFALLNTTATTVNFAGAATALNMGVIGGTATFAGALTVSGNLTVNGTTTTLNSTTLTVDDKNIEMAAIGVPDDATANGGGIIIKGTTDKTILWDSTNSNLTSNQDWNLPTGKVFKINNVSVLSSSSLGSGVTGSSLTQVGTITSGTWQGTQITDTYLATISTAGKVSNSATTATNANTASAIVARDASGNFSAGTITAALTGNASTATSATSATTATTATNIVATEQTTGTIFLVGVAAASSSTGLLVNASPAGALEYNVATGELSATLIDGGSF
jgi:hypothetical protein